MPRPKHRKEQKRKSKHRSLMLKHARMRQRRELQEAWIQQLAQIMEEKEKEKK